MDINTNAFVATLNDYIFLINKNYPIKETLKLVGDRYRLSGEQRTILYRGITTEDKIKLRRSKMTNGLKSQELHVDGYNVIFTIMNYILGKPVFISNDDIVRDAGSNFGEIKNQSSFDKAIEILLDILLISKPGSVVFYLDEPVSNSAMHKRKILKWLGKSRLKGDVVLVKSVDQELRQLSRGVIATSDSEIIDNTPCPVFDLARFTLDKKFQLKILDLNQLAD